MSHFMYRIITLNIVLGFIVLLASCQGTENNKKLVNTSILNIREAPTKSSNIVKQIKYGDIVFVDSIYNEEWVRINFPAQSVTGFVSSAFLSEPPNYWQRFKYEFGESFWSLFFTVFLITAAFKAIRKRVKDGRFSSGYRELPLSVFEIIVSALIGLIGSGILSSFNALIKA
jgi:hypothetical protein